MYISLTKPQRQIYNMEKFSGGSIAIICGSVMREGNIEPDIMKKAVNELYRLNDALRIRIAETESGPMQYISDQAAPETETLRFADNDKFDEFAREYAKKPLDIYGLLSEVKLIYTPDRCGALVKLHHIIGDAWTMALLGKQLGEILDGKTPEAYSYLDYVSSEQDYVHSRRYQKDKEFFLEQFKKCDEATYLSDKQGDDLSSERKTFVLSKEQTDKIISYAEKNDSGVFAVLMTAFAVYFSRVKMNASAFYIGAPVLNRNGLKEQNTAGMFINTVPILAEINSEATFAENLRRMTERTTAVLRHQHYNYEDLLAELRRSEGFGERLYDVMLSYQNAKTNAEGFASEWYYPGMQTESLQIHIDDRDGTGKLKIHYDYRLDRFSEKEIERMHGHIFNLFFDAINNATKKVYELEILSKAEKHKLLYEFNDTKADYPRDKCVHQLFEEQAAKTPNKTAVVACDKTLTYDELNRLSNRIANALIERGIKTGDIVAFALPRRSYLIAVMFGILKSGAAYMPIDPDYPKDRIDFMLSESDAKFFVTDKNLDLLLKSTNEKNPNVNVRQKDIYCALHTSGSTGTPKLALLTHKNIMAFMYANHRFYENVDATISVTIVTFDVFMQDTVMSITSGVKTILSSEEQIYNQTEFEKLFISVNSALFFATPTKLKKYIQESKTKEFLRHIGVFVVGGEVFPNELYDMIVDNLQEFSAYNGYGPVETTLCSSCNELPPEFTTGTGRSKLQSEILTQCYPPKKSITYTGLLKQPYAYVRNPYVSKYDCAHTLFENQALKTPCATAIIACDKTLSYDELNRQSNRIANSLIEKGVCVGDIIAFALPRTSVLISTILGILKSGAAYMPIDPDYPKDRIDFMLSDSGAKLFITKDNINEYISENEYNPNVKMSANNYCYCIYTSGSTGRPKGTLLYHKGIVNLVTNLELYNDLSRVKNIGFLTSITFDVATQEILTTLLNGFTGVLFPERKNTEISDIIGLIKRYKIDMFFTTPSYFDILTSTEEYVKEILSVVNTVVLAGEKFYLNKNVIEMMNSSTSFENQYGPAETHVITATTNQIIKDI